VLDPIRSLLQQRWIVLSPLGMQMLTPYCSICIHTWKMLHHMLVLTSK